MLATSLRPSRVRLRDEDETVSTPESLVRPVPRSEVKRSLPKTKLVVVAVIVVRSVMVDDELLRRPPVKVRRLVAVSD